MEPLECRVLLACATPPPAPEFPIGVFNMDASRLDDWKLRGVNIAMHKPTPDSTHNVDVWTDAACQQGLWVIRSPRKTSSTRNVFLGGTSYNYSYDPAADRVHRNLLGWLQPDEPDLDSADTNLVLQDNYTKWKNPTTGIDVPVYLTFSGGMVLGKQGNPPHGPRDTYYPAASAFADRVGNDFYPVTGWGHPVGEEDEYINYAKDGPYFTAGTAFEKQKQYSGSKSYYAFVETSDQDLPQAGTNGRGVTRDEFRGEVWDAIVHGAQGIIYFPNRIGANPATDFRFDATSEEVKLELPIINQRLKDLGPVLRSPHNPSDLYFNTPGWQPTMAMPLKAAWRHYGGKDYYIVLNMSDRALNDVTFELGGQGNRRHATVQFESRQEKLSFGRVTDSFGPYEAQVYVVPQDASNGPSVTRAVTNPTDKTRVTFKGSAPKGAVIRIDVLRDKQWVEATGVSTTAGDNGAWVLRDVPVTGGSYSVRVRATWGAGSSDSVVYSGYSEAPEPAVPAPAAAAPVIAGVGVTGPDVGSTTNAARVASGAVVFHGHAEPYAQVTVNRQNVGTIGTAVADQFGEWSFDYRGTTLPSGTHTFTASADVGGTSRAFTVSVSSAAAFTPIITHAEAGGVQFVNGHEAQALGTWRFHGRTEPGKAVRLYDHQTGALLASGTATGGVFALDYNAAGLGSRRYMDFVVTADITGGSADSAVFRAHYDGTAARVSSVTANLQPSGGAVDSITVTFSEPVEGVALADFTLSDGTTTVSLANAAISSPDNTTWTLENLSALGLSNATGTYTLQHTSPSKVVDNANRPLAAFPDFRFFLYHGTGGNDSIFLSPTADNRIGLWANGTLRHTMLPTAVDQILISGLVGDDSLRDELPASLRPARGVSFSGGAGATDQLFVTGGAANERFVAGNGEVRLTPAGSPATHQVRFELETLEHLHVASGDGDDAVLSFVQWLPVNIDAGAGNDTVSLNDAAVDSRVFVFAGAGDDTVNGSSTDDNIQGGVGSDVLRGGGGNDTVYGEANNTDDLPASTDHVYGGPGNDVLVGDGGAYGGNVASDFLYGEAGDDTLYGDNANGGTGATATDWHEYFAEGGNDTLQGGTGNDTLYGEDGDDVYPFGSGQHDGETVSEYAYGGIDTLDFSGFGERLILNLNSGTQQVGSRLTLNLPRTGVDNVKGTPLNDEITGNNRNNIIWGYAGNDTIRGDWGDDACYGGLGDDFLHGNGGLDNLVGDEGWDLIDQEDWVGDETYN